MERVELVIIVAPLMGHLTPILELAKLMLRRTNQLSISVLVMKGPFDPEGTFKVESLISSCKVDRLHFRDLPAPEDISQWNSADRGCLVTQLVDFQKPHVRETISKIKGFAGIIVDMISTPMIDVADEFGVPSYIFFNPGAAFLGLLFHFQALEDEQNEDISDLVQIETKLAIPSFSIEVPTSVLPVLATRKELWSIMFLKITRGYRRAKAIMINTFAELESHAVNSFSMKHSYGTSGLPPMFPVGPILNTSQMQTQSTKNSPEMMNWLDAQPENSVVFLSFGSLGSIKSEQLKEIALGLEKSGHRFLWVLRQPPAKAGGFAGEFEDRNLALPEGFLDRTASIGKVVSWVPQLAVLSHPAVGGFMSHCGWNSILESVWCGVPIATWPLHAEQQLNAFQLVKELGIAVEICLDYSEAKEKQEIVRAERVEKGIRELMDGESEVRKRVKEFSEKSRLAWQEGGSCYLSFENFMQSIGCD